MFLFPAFCVEGGLFLTVAYSPQSWVYVDWGLDSLALVAFYGDPVEIPETGQVTRSRANSELALPPLFPREEGWGDTK